MTVPKLEAANEALSRANVHAYIHGVFIFSVCARINESAVSAETCPPRSVATPKPKP
jgi:hypothetical protein